MRLVVSDKSNVRKTFSNSASLVPRLALGKGDVFRLPTISRGFEVVVGLAWVTVNGCDIFLASGERLVLPVGRDMVLVSALGGPLTLEVFGADFAPVQAMPIATSKVSVE
jgi:hypothetical protein